jgi:hypothetical protein
MNGCRLRGAAVAALVCAGLALAPAPARAWGADGHVIVAKIAELNLTPEARKEIQKLLGPIPISHPRIATYADFVKHNPDYPEYSKTAGWHFVDIPLGATFDPATHCPEQNCVIDQVNRLKGVLAKKDGKADDRLDALTFLVHLVGDMHQPLHCATRDDHGGNGLKVRFLGNRGNHLNLHSVWDENLVRAAMKRKDRLDFAYDLNTRITDDNRKSWKEGTPKDWALESHKLAETAAYCDSKGKPLPKMGEPDLDQPYVDRGTKTVSEQLQKGGVRLAALLNEALSGAP